MHTKYILHQKVAKQVDQVVERMHASENENNISEYYA
jgi:hypothetical protein